MSEQHQQAAPRTPGAAARTIRYTIPGRAQPAGSKRAVPHPSNGRPLIIDDNPKAAGWKTHVQRWTRPRTHRPLAGALRLDLTFYIPRPLSHQRADGTPNAAGELQPYPSVRPDVLKLARGVEDALTGIAYTDDAQIVSEHIHKRYGTPRVEITIKELPA